jgi:hypothetical protein
VHAGELNKTAPLNASKKDVKQQLLCFPESPKRFKHKGKTKKHRIIVQVRIDENTLLLERPQEEACKQRHDVKKAEIKHD